MGGCSAINCKNRNEAGYQTFRFPKEGERRKKWLINCRRNKWIPSSNSRLCEIHFESFQFEQNRQDGIKKLKPNAIPILFNVPNPPKMFNNIKQKRSADPICMKFPLILQYNSSISCSDENGAHSNSISTNNSNGPNISSTLLEQENFLQTWKQAVAAEITGSRTEGSDMREFVLNVIECLSNAGLNVKGIVSDMGSNNRAMWTCLGIEASRNNRVTSFSFHDQVIHVLADACHLVKNLKQATQTHCIFLSKNIQKAQQLPTNVVNGNYITFLWKKEVESAVSLRLLQHLNYIDIFPTNFSKMHVGSAIRYFDIRTVASLETAVQLKLLPSEALTTAWFVRLICNWIKMCTSRVRKTSITKRNKIKKYSF
ncbi:uncharacterized protein LOC120356833 isoform X2 [Solenopsis invicta]|uniref:uncharacterized protein LOC120356833 isoform X2 n=1 Tax=Solenopsis invicta TaxID=13686 RepID=UPI00193E6306|nr:uncharacterized protein LOC120356833 isoform X2 [Solenopsis invicta]